MRKIKIEVGLDQTLVAAVLAEALTDEDRIEMLLDEARMIAEVQSYIDWGLESRLESTRDYIRELGPYEVLAEFWLENQKNQEERND